MSMTSRPRRHRRNARGRLGQRAPAAAGARAAARVPGRARPRRGRDRGEPDRRGALERHLPDRRATAPRWCCAARPARRCRPSAHDVLREARLLRALRGHARARAGGARGVRGRGDDRLPVLRDGADRGRGDRLERARDALDTPGRAPADRRGADRRARGDPRGRLARRGPRGLRQADRLPGAPAAALHRAVGAQQDARDPRGRARRARGWPSTCPSPARRRSCTATTAWATRSSPPRPPRAWRRCSTGRWRRSATRSPTSATCA